MVLSIKQAIPNYDSENVQKIEQNAKQSMASKSDRLRTMKASVLVFTLELSVLRQCPLR